MPHRRQVLTVGILAGTLAPIFLFFAVPLGMVVVRSLNSRGLLSVDPASLGLSNYVALLSSSVYHIVLWNTFTVAIEATLICVVAAFPVSLLLSRLRPAVALWLLAVLIVPSVGSFVVSLYGMGLVLQRVGLLFTHTATVIGMVEYLLPFMILMLYARMATIDSELLRSANSLGANLTQVLRRVILPLSLPAVYSGGLIIFILGLGFFLTPAILGGPADLSVSLVIEEQVSILQWGVASALGVVLLIVTVTLYYSVARLSSLDQLATIGLGGQRGVAGGHDSGLPAWAMRTLWGWAVLAYLFVYSPIIVLLVGSFSPAPYLLFPPPHLSLQWYQSVFADPTWLASVVLSLEVGLATAVAATLLGLGGAVLVQRRIRKGRGLLRVLFVMPLIVPVILYAIAIFGVESSLRIAGTAVGYVIADTMLAVPFTFTVLAGGLAAAGVELEEAGVSLGASRVRAAVQLTGRQMLPSIAVAVGIAFLTSWGESVVSVLLSNGNPTLPAHIYEFIQTQLTPETAALASMMIGAAAGAAVLAWVGYKVIAGRRRVRSRRYARAVKWGPL